ncbi:MAG: helix-hairpin-helix domain-containing protein [Clostridium sp.]|uniref:helix-hairpin-helix domain-containing protein n=1 Tax=Clostridium sp. TaxID=1506 RepID=UPI0025C1A1D4|nr:helix-hairpin-helix domain-containing protein [Clostridium sp.]MCE5222144.1 helix-hairpin-helix domain-containing protein [Clostridium sp.]
MIQKLLKDKKKIGMFIILIIVLIAFGTLYLKSGFKELKKNDTESIFVDEMEDTDTSAGTANNNSISTTNKEVTIPIKDKSIVVEIKGEVKKPDVYTLNENAIIKELIEAAGGLTENADLSNINRAKKLQNHELVYIANKSDITKEDRNTNSELNTSNNQGVTNSIVNINTATIEQLKTLNGIGDSKAKSIIEYREQNGGFKSKEDIKNVTGIGEKMFERIKEQIET